MWKFLSRYSFFLVLSVGMHAVLLGALLFGFSSTPELPKPLGASKKKNVIQAVAVNESRIQDEAKKLQRAEDRRKEQEKSRQKKLEDEAEKANQQRIKEQKKIEELQKQQTLQQQKIKQQKLAEEKKIRELKKKQVQEQENIKKLKKAAAELARKKEAEVKRQKAEADKQKALKEKRKQEAKKREQKKLRDAQIKRENALKEQMAAEERAEQEKELQGVRSRYIDSIAAVVKGNWRRPAVVDKNASCLVAVTQIPGGEIISSRVSKCTGGANFQRSVETAVGKTTHLPAPPDPRVFDREIRFTFTVK